MARPGAACPHTRTCARLAYVSVQALEYDDSGKASLLGHFATNRFTACRRLAPDRLPMTAMAHSEEMCISMFVCQSVCGRQKDQASRLSAIASQSSSAAGVLSKMCGGGGGGGCRGGAGSRRLLFSHSNLLTHVPGISG